MWVQETRCVWNTGNSLCAPGRGGWPLAVTTLSVRAEPLRNDWLSDNDELFRLSRATFSRERVQESVGGDHSYIISVTENLGDSRIGTQNYKLQVKELGGLNSFSSVTQSQYVLVFPNEYASYDFTIVFKEAFSFILNDVWEIGIIVSWFKASSLLNKILSSPFLPPHSNLQPNDAAFTGRTSKL